MLSRLRLDSNAATRRAAVRLSPTRSTGSDSVSTVTRQRWRSRDPACARVPILEVGGIHLLGACEHLELYALTAKDRAGPTPCRHDIRNIRTRVSMNHPVHLTRRLVTAILSTSQSEAAPGDVVGEGQRGKDGRADRHTTDRLVPYS